MRVQDVLGVAASPTEHFLGVHGILEWTREKS